MWNCSHWTVTWNRTRPIVSYCASLVPSACALPTPVQCEHVIIQSTVVNSFAMMQCPHPHPRRTIRELYSLVPSSRGSGIGNEDGFYGGSGGWGGGVRDAHPSLGQNFIFMQFWGKLGQIVCWCSIQGWRPPSGKSWIRHWICFLLEGFLSVMCTYCRYTRFEVNYESTKNMQGQCGKIVRHVAA